MAFYSSPVIHQTRKGPGNEVGGGVLTGKTVPLSCAQFYYFFGSVDHFCNIYKGEGSVRVELCA